MTPAEQGGNQSVIHDIGFRHYDGPRLGRGWAFRSLLRETVRGAYGLGRPARSKIMPWTLVALFTLPALVLVTVTIVTGSGDLPLTYTQYPIGISLLISLFVAGRAPYAVSRDLRDGVIPLYLSRPLLRRDYVAAKVAGVTIAVAAFIAIPQTVLMIGALLAKLPAWETLGKWLGGLLIAVVLAIIVSALSLTIAAFTKRRGLGVAAILATLVLAQGFSNVVIGVVGMQRSEAAGSYGALLDPYQLTDGLANAWLGVASQNPYAEPHGALGVAIFTLAYLAAVSGALAVLFGRYKKVGAA